MRPATLAKFGFITSACILLACGSSPPRNGSEAMQPEVMQSRHIRCLSRINAIEVADFNRDGLNDIAVIGSERSVHGQLAILLQTRDGEFARVGELIETGATTSGLDSGDMNDDGIHDLVASQHDDLTFVVLLGKGDGTFHRSEQTMQFAMPTSVSPHAHNVVLEDVDGDKRLDIVSAQAELHKILMAPGRGDGTFDPGMTIVGNTGQHPYRITAADLNNDGRVDFITPNVESGNVTVLLRTDSGFESSTIDNEGRQTSFVVVGRLDHDGYPDLIVNGDEGSEFAIFRGNANPNNRGHFANEGWTINAPANCSSPHVVDLNQDGSNDLVSVSMSTSTIYAWFGKSQKGIRINESKPIAYSLDGLDAPLLQVADLNGNTFPDLLAGGWDSPHIAILLDVGK